MEVQEEKERGLYLLSGFSYICVQFVLQATNRAKAWGVICLLMYVCVYVCVLCERQELAYCTVDTRGEEGTVTVKLIL